MSFARSFIGLFLILCLPGLVYAQTSRPPLASFSFNGRSTDDVAQLQAKLVSVMYTADRFGNENHALFLSGNAYSYLNLGTSPRLKSRKGSISIWINIEHKVWSGSGVRCNPVILTKCNGTDDFFEAYAIYYMLESGRLVAGAAKDSTRDAGAHSVKAFERNRWQHVVMTYDDDHMALYLDAVLQTRINKKFETKFLSTDSVVVGTMANKKNVHYLNASVDDIQFYDYVLTPAEISFLFSMPDPNRNYVLLRWVLLVLAVLVTVLAGYFFTRSMIRKAVRKEKERRELDYKLLETELRVNRAAMNPHFLFNSLNTLHSFILEEELAHAADYLVKFSKLIRKTLESNMQESISLKQEIDLLEHYLQIENKRFAENIRYSFTTDDAMNLSVIHIPIMMLQPFLENAIWHGLLKREGEKIIRLSFSVQEKCYVYCEIEDNGTGRKQPGTESQEKKSMATGFIRQRLELLNKIHNLNCILIIEDKPGHSGTLIKLTLPILKNRL